MKFQDICVISLLQTLKIQIAVTIGPNFMMDTFCKSTDKSLSKDMLIIFFGCLIAKILTIQLCIFCLKFFQNLIKVYEYVNLHEISRFLCDFIAPTSKIQITASMCPNFITRIFCESTDESLSSDMLIIFFGCVVKNLTRSST